MLQKLLYLRFFPVTVTISKHKLSKLVILCKVCLYSLFKTIIANLLPYFSIFRFDAESQYHFNNDFRTQMRLFEKPFFDDKTVIPLY